jgi:transposase InsO family protein
MPHSMSRKGNCLDNAINQYVWDEQGGFYHNVDFIQGQKTAIQSLSTCFFFVRLLHITCLVNEA